MNTSKETARRCLSHLVTGTGISAAARRLFPKRGAVVLFGHRVAGNDEGYLDGVRPDWFRDQVDYLARHYEIIPLSELVSCLEKRRRVPEKSVVLTFDDGFKNNLEQAAPILKRYRAPATVFLVTGSVDSGRLPWSQRLGVLFQQTSASAFRHPITGNTPLDLSTSARRRLAYLTVKEKVKGMGHEVRERLFDELSAMLAFDPPRDRMLSWDEVRQLMADGLEIGAHTFSHSLLARIPESEARWEMERSRDDLREHLGIDRPSFAFPAGSMTPRLVDLARRLGFRSVFQKDLRRRVNKATNASPFSISRTGLPNGPAAVLEAELDGPFHALRCVYRRWPQEAAGQES